MFKTLKALFKSKREFKPYFHVVEIKGVMRDGEALIIDKECVAHTDDLLTASEYQDSLAKEFQTLKPSIIAAYQVFNRDDKPFIQVAIHEQDRWGVNPVLVGMVRYE